MTADELHIHRVAVLARMAATLEAGDRAKGIFGPDARHANLYASRAQLLYEAAEIAASRLEPAP